jgi:hypothetical protein
VNVVVGILKACIRQQVDNSDSSITKQTIVESCLTLLIGKRFARHIILLDNRDEFFVVVQAITNVLIL